jgi:eight-cysteine-cluster-containing protein
MEKPLDKKQTLLILVAGFVIIVCILIILLNKKQIVTEETGNKCIKTGCSGQLCINDKEPPQITTCEWKEIYSCYRLTECELQNNGECGFTPNSKFNDCLSKNTPPNLPSKKSN